MTAWVLAVLALSVQADTTTLQETIHRFDPASGAYGGSETTWFGPDGRRLRLEERDSTGVAFLTFLVLHDEAGRESGAVYLEEGGSGPSQELFTYSPDGMERTTTYVSKDGTLPETTVDDLDAQGREVRKRYFRADGTQYGEEGVFWTEDGDRAGWDFAYVGREGGASFRYEYERFDADGAWTHRLMLRDGTPLRREVRSLTRGPVSFGGLDPVPFMPGVITTEQSETSPSFTADGRMMVFARYGEEWSEKLPFIAYLEEEGWRVEPLDHLGEVYNLAISPDGTTVVHSVQRGEGAPHLFRTRRIDGGGWSVSESITAEFGLAGSYPALTDEGHLLFYRADGPAGDGIYLAPAEGSGFGAPEPFFTPGEGTTFDGFAATEGGPLWVTRCFDEVCDPEGGNGLWLARPSGSGGGSSGWISALPYGWGFQPVESLNLLVFTDGEDILSVSLGTVAGAMDRVDALDGNGWLDALVGQWDGVLEYLDYGDDSTRVTLPTGLLVRPSQGGDSFTLAYSYGEPDGRTVSSVERVSEDGNLVFFGGFWNVESRLYDAVSGSFRLELVRDGEDNGRPARLWNLIEVGGEHLTITNTVRYEGPGERFQRNQYRFTRR